jgi:hypothetical protein
MMMDQVFTNTFIWGHDDMMHLSRNLNKKKKKKKNLQHQKVRARIFNIQKKQQKLFNIKKQEQKPSTFLKAKTLNL